MVDTREPKEIFENVTSRIAGRSEKVEAERKKPLVELNGPAPDFTAKTTQGEITLSKWARDKWVVLFSHPADFTPVCTTEFMEFAKRYDEFQQKNVALLGNSIDSVYSHIAWVRNIKEKFGVEIPYPIIADLDQTVSQLYGMVHEPSADTAAVRTVFFIDPKRTVRAMIYYPLNVGRNMDEILRVVDALQAADETGLAAPVNWRSGDDMMVPPPGTTGQAEERLHATDMDVTDWYFSKKRPSQG